MTMNLIDTWRTVLQRPALGDAGSGLLVHIYPTGPGLGTCYPLLDHPCVIGRGEDSDISVYHPSVSRQHARIESADECFRVTDLGSTNGTFINDQPVTPAPGEPTLHGEPCDPPTGQPLKDGDYLRVGNCIFRFLSSNNLEAKYHEEIYRLIIIDALTDIPNQRYLTEFLDRELARAARYRRALAVVLFDIDRFKAINDRLGHLGGDFTLRELASIIKACVRREELFARYGGEEFVIVLPETAHERAVQISERVRHLIASHPFHYDGQSFQVTISMGVASTAGEHGLTPTELLRRADAKLYEAKRGGSNRVVA
jgi:two-component system, cell cycle response regulator